jgi:hypothetical protein
MNWLTLTFGEVAAFSAVASALALWLYLRRPRSLRLRVSTLRFWESAPSGSSKRRRLRLREPWPFLAQLFFLIALIAAFGNPRRGAAVPERRSVAMVIDSSAWSQMEPKSGAPWLEQIRKTAKNVLEGLPAGDRVALFRADADGAPILPFTTDRTALKRAIDSLQSSSAVPDVPRALAQGRAGLSESSRGLLVYVGPGIMDLKQMQALEDFRGSFDARSGTRGTQFLVRLIGDSAPLANRGITRLALKRGEERPDQWSLLVDLKNYEAAPANVTLNLAVNGQVFHREPLNLAANETSSATYDFTSLAGGLVQAEISPSDALQADDRAAIDLPLSQPVSVAVLTGRGGFITKLRMVLSSNPYVRANFMSPDARPKADVIIYDGAVPPDAPEANSISFLPVPQGSTPRRMRLGNWDAQHPVTRWIQSRDVSVRAAGHLEAQKGDTVLASSTGNSSEPLILAREKGGYRSVVVGFDPLDSNFTMEPAFPLLVAASVEWMTRPVEDSGDGLTAGTLDLPFALHSIVAPSGREVPFARVGDAVHFFAGESGRYRITGPGGSADLMVNMPQLPTQRWKPTAEEEAAVESEPEIPPTRDLWRWLFGFALLALWAEWQLFYFIRVRAREHDAGASSGRPWWQKASALESRAEKDRESVIS